MEEHIHKRKSYIHEYIQVYILYQLNKIDESIRRNQIEQIMKSHSTLYIHTDQFDWNKYRISGIALRFW